MLAQLSELNLKPFTELSAFALVLWLVWYLHKHVIPGLVTDFRDALKDQQKCFSENLDCVRDDFKDEMRAIREDNKAETQLMREENTAQLSRLTGQICLYQKRFTGLR